MTTSHAKAQSENDLKTSEEMMKQAKEMMKQAKEMMEQALELQKKLPQYSDSIGVYALTEDGFKHIEPTKPHKFKATPNIIGVNGKLHFKGNRATLRYDSIATFRIYFGIPYPQDAKKYELFSPPCNIKDYCLVKLSSKKTVRQLRTISIKFLSTKKGAKECDDATTEITPIRKGVYELRIKGEPGEYGITYNANGLAGYYGIFDFGINRDPNAYVSYWD